MLLGLLIFIGLQCRNVLAVPLEGNTVLFTSHYKATVKYSINKHLNYVNLKKSNQIRDKISYSLLITKLLSIVQLLNKNLDFVNLNITNQIRVSIFPRRRRYQTC